MQTAPDLSDLIARLEKATGQDRRLDLDVSFAVNYREAFTGAVRAEWSVMADDINVYDATGQRGYLDPEQFVPQWTRSIDAAVSLVPKGWCGYVWFGKKDGAFLAAVKNNKRGIDLTASAATPAIATTVAALKARMQGGE